MYSLPGHTDHAFSTPSALSSRFAHPGLNEALGLQAIEGRVQRTNRASASGRVLNLSSDRSTISFLA
jgi:hypothetical protein